MSRRRLKLVEKRTIMQEILGTHAVALAPSITGRRLQEMLEGLLHDWLRGVTAQVTWTGVSYAVQVSHDERTAPTLFITSDELRTTDGASSLCRAVLVASINLLTKGWRLDLQA